MKNFLLISFCCHALTLVFLLHSAGYRINLTDSMAHGVYQIVPGKPMRGDLITFSLDEQNPYFSIALERHYLGWNNRPLLKVLVGLPGDTLQIDKEGISINSELLPRSKAKPTDRHGKPLPIFLNSTVIPSGKCLALSTHSENSFDGRYFGLVDLDRLQRVVPVLTIRLFKNKSPFFNSLTN
ncbi:conjugative transfer signal peptidase TraF [Desulfovibrio sp. JC022]|uniref:conjugative transfer signal peptidase TraF n=1 Tax=Desulfovibrio sp. JC022 TaxID=2593642 RepID=UPI0013D6B58A|nr:conjugative transfer signal peptidase TraF [Desulfovibrio sp. JC022]NDV24858.1 conjugative transfer signal peptidase TraF [Desulfovibrio sp. JC022]